MGGSAAAAAEEVAIAGGSGAGRGVRNSAAKFASLTGALRRHSRNAGLGGGGSGGGEDDTPTAFCKEPATPHMWLCSRQPRTPLGFLPRLGRSSSGESSGGGPGGPGFGSGISSRGKGGKESLDPPNLRRHFTTVSGSDALGLEGAKGRSGGGKSGRQGGAVGGSGKAHKESGGSSMGALDVFSSGRADGGGSITKAGEARAGRGGKKMSFFSGFGGASSKGSEGERSRQRTSLAGDPHGGGMGGGAGEETDEESVRTVPLQLEDEGLLQVSV